MNISAALFLKLALDLETAERERMVHPAHIEVDVQADAQLLGRDVIRAGRHGNLMFLTSPAIVFAYSAG